MRKCSTLLIALVIAACGSAFGQGYRIDWYSISSGGGDSAGTGYKLSATVGQSAAGYVESASLKHWIGFWIPEAESEPPVVVSTLAEAKALADGTLVSISGKVVTSAVGDFAGFFYIEETDRSSGIRISASPSAVSGLARGSVVNVIGRMGTLSSGERHIVGPVVVIASTRTPLTPLGMPGRSIGGGHAGTPPLGQFGVTGGFGLNNVGLLIQTWGRVTATGTGYVVIDDGSGPVTVDTSALASPPALQSYVSVIGISSLYQSAGDRLRLVLPRQDTDIKPR